METPDERLEVLYQLLIEKKYEEALALFEKHSSFNHISRFEIVLSGLKNVGKVGDYIIMSAAIPFESMFIVGLDDNFNFFCHNLGRAQNLATESDIRREMGFDYHWWEIDNAVLFNGVRVRMQGDLILSVVRLLDVDNLYNDLYAYLSWNMLSQLLQITNIEVEEVFRKEILRSVSDKEKLRILSDFLESHIDTAFNSKIYFHGLTRLLFSDKIYSKERIVQFLLQFVHLKVKRAIKVMFDQEKSITFYLGRHKIKLIGVDGRAIFASLWNIRAEAMANTVYLLREQTIVFYHPEHKTTDISLPPSVIRLETLRSGVLGRTLIIPSAISSHVNSLCRNMFDIINVLVVGARDEDRLSISWPYAEGRMGILPMSHKNVFVLKDCFFINGAWRGFRFIIRDIDAKNFTENMPKYVDVVLVVGTSDDDFNDIANKVHENKTKVIFVILDYEGKIVSSRWSIEGFNTIIIDPFDALARRELFRVVAKNLVERGSF